jgi:hypothetical protein
MTTTARPLVYVIPCGAAKLNRPAAARDLYTGSMFRFALTAVLAEAARTDAPVRVMILSALYGLVDLDTVLSPYNVTMTSPQAITADRLADQLAEVLGPGEGMTEVYAFLPAAYRERLAQAAEIVNDRELDGWALVHNVYEAAPGIGYQRQVLANLNRLESEPVQVERPAAPTIVNVVTLARWVSDHGLPVPTAITEAGVCRVHNLADLYLYVRAMGAHEVHARRDEDTADFFARTTFGVRLELSGEARPWGQIGHHTLSTETVRAMAWETALADAIP